jgi:hypothetical protein
MKKWTLVKPLSQARDKIKSHYSENYAKGGEIAKAEILGLKRNIMGTTDIEMKITGMRKPQSFIVYPISKDDSGDIITIQSETRIGKIDLSTGRGLMSQSHSNGAYFVHFQMDKKTSFVLSDNDLKNLKEHINKTSGASVGTRGIVTDNSGASKVFANGGNKFELGGVMVSDLAGHTSGSLGTGDPTLLSDYSGTYYGGLTGETGAMSAGEMFEAGGTLSDPAILNAYSGTRYTGLVAETGALSSGEMFMNGGGLPDGAQQSYVNYYLGSTGILAEGGSLEAHGIEEGDTFIKTIAGNIQKVKDKDGKIVFINLSTGERDSQPPLPFKKGGNVDGKWVNNSQDYEVRYAKGKNRHGYGHIEYADGGKIEFSEKRKDYLENLGNLEAEVWDKIGASSGGQIRGDKTLLKKYAEGVAKIMETEGIGYGSFDQQDYDFYTDENWHLFNEFLVWNNYYEPEMTKVEKAWRKKAFEKDPKHNYISNPEVITLNSTKRTNEQEANTVSFKPTVEFNVGDVVWQKSEKMYGVVMDNYGNKKEGSSGDIRLDSTGNTNIFEYDKNYENIGYNLVKFGSSEDAGDGNVQDIKDSANRLIKSQIQYKDKEKEKYYREIFKRVLAGEFDNSNSSKPIAKMIPNLKKHYVSHDNIESVTVKKGGKEVTYNAKDVLNGANMLEKGGQLEKIANYISKNNVVDVELKDGTTVKPSNGYWIKKGATPIGKMEKGGKVEEAIINKDGIRVRSVSQPKKKLTESEWMAKHSESKEARSYKAGGDLSKYSEFIQDEFASSKKLANKFAKKYNLPFLVLVEKDNDDEIYVKEANGFYAFPKSYIDAHDVLYVTADKMAEGGATFDEKSSAIAKKFEGKSVEPKYQKEYGKVYSKEEADKVGDKIAGSMVAKDKMKKGGVTSRGGIMLLAKQIRKENESWKDALKRAGEQLRK